MQALLKNKGTIIGAILLLLALFAYNSFFANEPLPDTPSATTVGADLIKISDNISKATLSRDLFSTTGYRLLSDFSKPLDAEPVGRNNPFAPIGQE